MKRMQSLVFLFLFALMCGPALAAPIGYTETYLGGPAYFDLGSGQSKTFNFDLFGTNPGATKDANGYVPGTAISEATLRMTISSKDLFPESLLVFSSAADGGAKIFEDSMWLGNFSWRGTQRESLDIEIYLDALGLAQHIEQDGKFSATIAAPYKFFGFNNFRVDEVSLSVGAAPVPEPGTFLLLAGGLMGLASVSFARRKRSARA